jgi:hypothetical protein
MDYPRDNTFTFLFSTYKRTAGIAFAAILIIAIPVTLALLGQQQDVRQRASEVLDSSILTEPMCEIRPACLDSTPACSVREPAGGWCPAGTLLASGAYRWVGHCTSGCQGDSHHLLYINMRNTSTYTASGIGTVNADGKLEGNLATSQDQKGTFVATPTTCFELPARCTVISATGTPQCESGTGFPTKPDNMLWCPATTVDNSVGISSNDSSSGSAIFDLNDDGKLDAIDKNILYSSFSNRQGD